MVEKLFTAPAEAMLQDNKEREAKRRAPNRDREILWLHSMSLRLFMYLPQDN